MNRNSKYLIKPLIVNDNKRLIPLFEGKFNKFLLRHKGTDMNSPEAIINLLNSRPKSFLKTLENLVIPFKNIDRNMKMKRVRSLSPLNSTDLNGTDILTKKIDSLTQSLQNNKLSIPFNLLKPLNKKAESNFRQNKYLGIFLPFNSINSYQQNIHFNTSKRIQNLFSLLEYAFIAMSSLISKPVYLETPDKININLFYFLIASDQMNKVTAPIATSYNGIGIKNIGNTGMRVQPLKLFNQNNIQKLNLLCLILSRIFKKPVELDLIRLHLPYYDDNILVKAIGIMSKDINIRHIFNIIFTKTKIATLLKSSKTGGINSNLAGIKIKISGRLMTQRVIPRLTTRVIQKGAITRGKINYINSSRVNLKNKRGAHSITVTMSHLI